MKERCLSLIKKYCKLNLRFAAIFGVTLILIIIFSLLNPSFLEIKNLMNIVRQTCVLAIIAAGMTNIIITGGIDLSVGANLALCGMVAGIVTNATGNGLLGLLSAIGIGMVIGFFNGFLIGKMKITAFIVTLGMMSVARGATLAISEARSFQVHNSIFEFIGQSEILGIPVTLFIVIITYLIFTKLNNSFVMGKHIYCIGGNIFASKAMGIKVDKRLIQIYTIAGGLVGIGAAITVGRMSSAQPYSGMNLEFDVITAVVLGGTSLLGGSGTLLGTLMGATLVGVISNGLSLTKFSPFFMYIIKGLLVLIAVLLDQASIKYRESRLTPTVVGEKKNEKINNKIGDLVESHIKRVTMKNVTKVYPGMKALDNVTVSFESGEIHALMGENGAGKSTLMKILAGEIKSNTGTIDINDIQLDVNSPQKANQYGIALIHQEFSLVRELKVYQNIFLGNEIKSSIPGLVDINKMKIISREILKSINSDLDVEMRVKDLSISEQQMVEIAKALRTNAWLIILDEPTSSLTDEGKESLFKVMKNLKDKGVCMIYISHRMQEIYEIADNITILRDGVKVGTFSLKEISPEDVIHKMVGRKLDDVFKRQKVELGETILEVENLNHHNKFKNISFKVREGEVLGFSGLVGAGRTEIAKSIFGLDRYDSGSIYIDGQKVNIKDSPTAIKHGIAYVPEDRRKEGFIPYLSIKTNLVSTVYEKISKWGKISVSKEQRISDEYIHSLNIKTVSEEKNVIELSGGNQQKVSLGKWLASNPKILILDEPTRGIDIGAKLEIYKIIEQIAKQGIAVIMISSELPELLGCSDNIIVIREGEITGKFITKDVTQDIIMEKAAHTTGIL